MAMTQNRWIGLVVCILALVLLFVWIPLDVETGIVEKIRRQVEIGDALGPTVAGVFLLLGGVILAFVERPPSEPKPVDGQAIRFALLIVAYLVACFLVMLVTGPAAVWIANQATGSALEYRLLRDTVPWKYLGFLTGGTLAILGVISLAERRVSLKALIVAIAAVIAMIAIYDLPFDDLLLPPNGDF